MTKASDLFNGPDLKVRRARQHIDELRAKLEAFLATDFCTLRVEKDADGTHRLNFRMTRAIPEDLTAIVGDAVHNLRAALDLATCELVKRAGEEPSRQTYFPATATRADLVKVLGKGQMPLLGESVSRLLLDEIQPFEGGKGDVIWALHRRDIDDKHRELIPVISVTSLHHVNAIVMGGFVFQDCTLAVSEDMTLAVVSMPGPFEFQGGGIPSFSALFGPGHFEGQPILPTLEALVSSVDAILQRLRGTHQNNAQAG